MNLLDSTGNQHTEHFLPPHSEPPKPERLFPWKKAYLALGLFVVISIGLFIAPLVFGLSRAGASALSLRGNLKTAERKALDRDFSAAADALGRAEGDLSGVRAGLQSLGAWRSAPWIGSRISALEQAEQAGSSALSGFRELLSVAASVQEALDSAAALSGVSVDANRSYRDLSKQEKRAAIQRLYEALPQLRLGREKIAIAAQAWERVPQNELLGPIRSAIAPLANRLPELDTSLGQALDLLEWAVPLAGYPEPKNYLVVLQNADELRATGGFIGNVGMLKVDAGDIASVEFEDVYTVDNPVASTWRDIPPDPIRRYLGVPAWYLRDSNWNPDFPSAAARLADVYIREMKQGRNIDVSIDGVIALQPEFFRQLLILTGPLYVEDKEFNAQNFFDVLQYDVNIGFGLEGIPIPQRKEIVQKLGDVLINKLFDIPADRWPTLLNIVTTSLKRSDILISVRDKPTQDILDRRGWNGRTIGTDDDYLWVIDSNLGALKTDGVMDKEVIYSVDATDPANPVATVRLRYKNNTQRIDWRYTRYQSYTRIYVPEGSQLISSQGAASPDVYRELGKTVFAAYWVIQPGRTGELVFRYRLPSSVAARLQAGPYRFTAQKQPGARRKLTLDLSFGKNVVRAVPGEDENEFGDARYRYSDQWLETETFEINF